VNGDATHLPVRDAAFDVTLAPHMLYHVPDLAAAAGELRRVTRAGGVCLAVTNGHGHTGSLRRLIEVAGRRGSPGWVMRAPADHFSLGNGRGVLEQAFASVTIVRPTGVAPVRLREAGPAADYVASIADHYRHEVARPWDDVVADVRAAVQRAIDADGAFTVESDIGAFVCR
jgi:SAM-dependent methyltransferase